MLNSWIAFKKVCLPFFPKSEFIGEKIMKYKEKKKDLGLRLVYLNHWVKKHEQVNLWCRKIRKNMSIASLKSAYCEFMII